MNEKAVGKLARAAGLILEWTDSEGNTRNLEPDIQRLLLPLLGFPVSSDEEIRSGLKELERLHYPESPAQLPPLITADQGAAFALPCPLAAATGYVIELEGGLRQEGQTDENGRIPAIAETGYHQLSIGDSRLTVAVAPARCFSVEDKVAKDLAGNSSDQPPKQPWGLATQLYSLRRPGDGGLGDTGALEDFCRSAAGAGASAVTVNPTHAMFSSDPAHYSPYSPSSRLLHNALYSSPESIFGQSRVQAAVARCGLEQQLENLESLELIDWPAAGRARLTWLRALYEDFGEGGNRNDSSLYQQFMRFREQSGATLEDHCRFEALSERQGPGSWRNWPAEFRDPASAAVEKFARDHAHEVGFHAFLQWLVADGLQQAQNAALDAGMSIGLIADLAVGANDSGSQAWSRQAEMLTGLSIGAPPDCFNINGQDWGLSSFSPHGLIRSGFRSFIDMLRANFARAGGLRIDHILGFLRLWLVPEGMRPDQGGYVRFPLEDLLRLTALESVRHEAVVLGEDLGTVAPGFRKRLSDRSILGTNVLWFERNKMREFLPPGHWSPAATAMTSTHDLPTVAGWWTGRDLEWRGKFDLLPETGTMEAEQKHRAIDRARLARALGLSEHPEAAELQAPDIPVSNVLAACARHLGRTLSPLAIIPVEDLLGLEEQANLPGTITEHPNWRRRWSPVSREMLNAREVRQRLGELDCGRVESGMERDRRADSDRKLAMGAAQAPRIAIESVEPSLDQGRFAAKAIVGDPIPITAVIFSDGHDLLSAVVRWRKEGGDWQTRPMAPVTPPGNDLWEAEIRPEELGRHQFVIEAWRDVFSTYRDELYKKHHAGIPVGLELEEGCLLIVEALERSKGQVREDLNALHTRLEDSSTDSGRVTVMLDPDTHRLMEKADAHRHLVRSAITYPFYVDRVKAGFSSWYELFPRSETDDPERHGTFRDVQKRLPMLRDMGFDVLYFTPIHPIGRTHRKGRNNTLEAGPGDVGSPYAIGSEEGGHDAIHPELGTFEDFRELERAAAAHGLEIALDFAIQCSPDHPWLKEHPGWFSWRPDGSIRYAENPPKKYQDIVNVDFYAEAAIPDLWLALRDVVQGWIEQGVRIFRVDNPHTKPFPFWEWLIDDIRSRDPGIIFLSEAFTRPAVMLHLGKLGFTQSYTYFTWRTTKTELTEYLTTLSRAPWRYGYRPNFFINTPDINPYFLQSSSRAGFLIRAALAALGSGSWGMYSGYELCENEPVAGKEEYLHSEKYEIRPRDYSAPGNIVYEISQLNRIRRENPAFQSHLGISFHFIDNDRLLYFCKRTPDDSNVIFVVISLDPFEAQEGSFELPLWKFGLPDDAALDAEDLMTGHGWTWYGKWQWTRLDPSGPGLPFGIWRVNLP